MKSLLRSYLFFACLSFSLGVGSTRAAEPTRSSTSSLSSAVAAADEERMAAVKAADPARLSAILSDDLRYAHSNGKVDNKASFMDSLVSHKTVYEKFDYKERTIWPAGPGVAIMSGRVVIDVRTGEQKQSIDLNYLAVWREENGKWRFLAWQSCRIPAPAASTSNK
jgi:ketosteroid isomerase-like protein